MRACACACVHVCSVHKHRCSHLKPGLGKNLLEVGEARRVNEDPLVVVALQFEGEKKKL